MLSSTSPRILSLILVPLAWGVRLTTTTSPCARHLSLGDLEPRTGRSSLSTLPSGVHVGTPRQRRVLHTWHVLVSRHLRLGSWPIALPSYPGTGIRLLRETRVFTARARHRSSTVPNTFSTIVPVVLEPFKTSVRYRIFERYQYCIGHSKTSIHL